MKTQFRNLRLASILAPLVLAGSVAPLGASVMTLDLGSVWAGFDLPAGHDSPMSPTSVTVTSDGLDVAINPGAAGFQNSHSAAQTVTDSPSADFSLWFPDWTPVTGEGGVFGGPFFAPPSKGASLPGLASFEDLPGIPGMSGADPIFSATPEPTALGRLAIGSGLLMLRRRKRA